jgi:1L-myo-inositol 1-phosphate cytidylyltransferase
MPLLRRTLLALRENGVRDVAVVIGYRGDEIRAAFGAEVEGVRLTWIDNPEWEKPNGVSLCAARGFLRGRAFLLMADHLFCPDVLGPLTRLEASGDGVILVVDPDIGRCYDIEDATKVRRSGNLIVAIGKDLEDYDAIDTGIFVISPALVAELAQHEAPSLSDGVRAMAARGLVRSHDIDGKLWQDVDTPETKRHAEWMLRAYGQDLRGRLPLDGSSGLALRAASVEHATSLAAALRARGLLASVTGAPAARYVRVSAPSGVSGAALLEITARTVGEAASDHRLQRMAS